MVAEVPEIHIGSPSRDPKAIIWTLATAVVCLCVIGIAAFRSYRIMQVTVAAQKAATYGLTRAYQMGLRRVGDPDLVLKQTCDYMAPTFNEQGLSDVELVFKSEISGGVPTGTATVSVPILPGLPPQFDVSAAATVIETDSPPPFITCFAIAKGGPWGGAYMQIPALAGSQFNEQSTSDWYGSLDTTKGLDWGHAAIVMGSNCEKLELNHWPGRPTTEGWQY